MCERVAGQKTVMMLLKGSLFHSRPSVIRMNGTSLRYKTVVKYLEISIGEGMSFLPHFERVNEILLNVVGQIHRVLRCEWGLTRLAVRVIYGGLFVACATYVLPL